MEEMIQKLAEEVGNSWPTLAIMVGIILQLLKKIDFIAKAKPWFPFISMGVATALAMLLKIADPVQAGLVIGLVTSGGYDLIKAPTKSG